MGQFTLPFDKRKINVDNKTAFSSSISLNLLFILMKNLIWEETHSSEIDSLGSSYTLNILKTFRQHFSKVNKFCWNCKKKKKPCINTTQILNSLIKIEYKIQEFCTDMNIETLPV